MDCWSGARRSRLSPRGRRQCQRMDCRRHHRPGCSDSGDPFLCGSPPRDSVRPPPLPDDFDSGKVRWVPAAQGMIAGVALTLLSVTISALFFGVYGYGLSIVSPFIIGAIAAYFANRKQDVGPSATTRIALGATCSAACLSSRPRSRECFASQWRLRSRFRWRWLAACWAVRSRGRDDVPSGIRFPVSPCYQSCLRPNMRFRP